MHRNALRALIGVLLLGAALMGCTSQGKPNAASMASCAPAATGSADPEQELSALEKKLKTDGYEDCIAAGGYNLPAQQGVRPFRSSMWVKSEGQYGPKFEVQFRNGELGEINVTNDSRRTDCIAAGKDIDWPVGFKDQELLFSQMMHAARLTMDLPDSAFRKVKSSTDIDYSLFMGTVPGVGDDVCFRRVQNQTSS